MCLKYRRFQPKPAYKARVYIGLYNTLLFLRVLCQLFKFSECSLLATSTITHVIQIQPALTDTVLQLLTSSFSPRLSKYLINIFAKRARASTQRNTNRETDRQPHAKTHSNTREVSVNFVFHLYANWIFGIKRGLFTWDWVCQQVRHERKSSSSKSYISVLLYCITINALQASLSLKRPHLKTERTEPFLLLSLRPDFQTAFSQGTTARTTITTST